MLPSVPYDSYSVQFGDLLQAISNLGAPCVHIGLVLAYRVANKNQISEGRTFLWTNYFTHEYGLLINS